MRTLKITKTKIVDSAIKSSSDKCPRCYGCLISDCETEFEIFFQKCVFCGYRHELKTQNITIDNSQSLDERPLEF